MGMALEKQTGKQFADRPLREPRVGGSVWPRQCCPAFTTRKAVMDGEQGCWYCRYADFHLKEQVSLEVGICCWPRIQIE